MTFTLTTGIHGILRNDDRETFTPIDNQTLRNDNPIVFLPKQTPRYSFEKCRSPKVDCYVYLIQNLLTGNVKIGASQTPLKRFSNLQSGIDCELKFLCQITGDERLERHLHQKFAKHHIRGEWFRFEEDIQKYFFSYIQKREETEAANQMLSSPSRQILKYLNSCKGGSVGKRELEQIARPQLDIGRPSLIRCLRELKDKKIVVIERSCSSNGNSILIVRLIGGAN